MCYVYWFYEVDAFVEKNQHTCKSIIGTSEAVEMQP
jgi:hypothetical protein